MKSRRNERGIALIMVLWVGLLIAAIAGAFLLDTRTSTQLARNFLDNAEARALADGGVHLAVYELIRPDDETAWRRDGRPYRRTVPGGLLHIAVEDEAGKIDINFANRDLIEGLFRSVGLTDERTQAIAETVVKLRIGAKLHVNELRSTGMSEDQIKSLIDTLGSGIEQNLTASGNVGRSRSRAVRAFRHLDDLSQALGITPALYARLRPALTIYGNEGVNYLSAPREALLAIPGISGEAVDAFLEARAVDDPTAPLDEFLAQGGARNYWRRETGDIVTVKVIAQSSNGAKFSRVAIVELGGSGDSAFVVKEWREGDLTILQPTEPTIKEASPLPGRAS